MASLSRPEPSDSIVPRTSSGTTMRPGNSASGSWTGPRSTATSW